MKTKLASILATAAAVAFVSSPITATLTQAASSKVPCYGVNSCKGKSACKTASNGCKGQNSCKGKGVKMLSPKKCAKMKGTTTEPAAAPADAAVPASTDAAAPATTDAAAPASADAAAPAPAATEAAPADAAAPAPAQTDDAAAADQSQAQ